ncbi:uncharacterized protein LOC130712991 [Lotus japonicus]|uniref:uncharacterized protein LOC130712991 n=1 Tax=Lotus japonicus TaxID=34305 RepID=UPI00258BCF28|nr:uncharacterized protein LOC130712991 [Lotus japonicus]
MSCFPIAIKLKPTFETNVVRRISNYTDEAVKDENFTRRCPPGKVPIHKKTMRHQILESQIKGFHQKTQDYPYHHLVHLDTTQDLTFRGASASISLYNLSLQGDQFSISQIWLGSGPDEEINNIQVGCGVFPNLYGDSQLRLTSYWTANGYKTGCYNVNCPGFVQVSPDFAMGSTFGPTSTIGSDSSGKVDLLFKVLQDRTTGNWWVIMGGNSNLIGYWPKNIFTHLKDGASWIQYGGETYTTPNLTSPPMGSGRLPREHFRNAAYFSNIKIVDSDYNEVDIQREDMETTILTNPNCYDLLYQGYQGKSHRQAFLFGGPGGQCGP